MPALAGAVAAALAGAVAAALALGGFALVAGKRDHSGVGAGTATLAVHVGAAHVGINVRVMRAVRDLRGNLREVLRTAWKVETGHRTAAESQTAKAGARGVAAAVQPR